MTLLPGILLPKPGTLLLRCRILRGCLHFSCLLLCGMLGQCNLLSLGRLCCRLCLLPQLLRPLLLPLLLLGLCCRLCFLLPLLLPPQLLRLLGGTEAAPSPGAAEGA